MHRECQIAIAALALVVLLPFAGQAQRWDTDPVVDSLKESMHQMIVYQGWLAYCSKHAHERECDGFNDHIPSQFVDYQEALKLRPVTT